MCSCQNLLDLRIQWILLVGGNLLNEQVQQMCVHELRSVCVPPEESVD